MPQYSQSAMPRDLSSSPVAALPIVVIGPPDGATGGMATVMAHHLGMNEDRACADAIRLLGFPMTQSPGADESRVQKITRHLGHLQRLRKTIRCNHARIVHIHTCSGASCFRSLADALVARLCGCRVILHIHGAYFDRFFEKLDPLRAAIVRRGLAAADRVIALSQEWKGKLRRISPKAKVHVVENAVDVPRTCTDRSEAGRRATGRLTQFLLMARMDEWKGIDDLLEACQSLRTTGSKFHVTLAGPPGTAGDENSLPRKIESGGLQESVTYVGPVFGAEKMALLRDADVYVQPSHHEGMPMSILEAMAEGLPVVATRVGAIPEIIKDRVHGWLTPPHHPGALASAMKSAITSDALRRSMGTAAYRLARTRFSLGRFHQSLLHLYRNLCATVPNVIDSAAPGRYSTEPSQANMSESKTADHAAPLNMKAR